MITIEELAESGECPCEVCSSQDEEDKILKKEKMEQLNEVCDLYSNFLIDYLLENHIKDILKQANKKNKVK